MPSIRSPSPLEVAAGALVLGSHLMATHSNGMSALQLVAQLHVTYKTAWLLAQKLLLSMVDPDWDLLEDMIEVDQTEVPFRIEASYFDEAEAKKILIIGAVEVPPQDGGRWPRAIGANYINTCAGCIHLAAIRAQHLSRAPADLVPRGVRLPVQPAAAPLRQLRAHPRAGLAAPADGLLGHHRPGGTRTRGLPTAGSRATAQDGAGDEAGWGWVQAAGSKEYRPGK